MARYNQQIDTAYAYAQGIKLLLSQRLNTGLIIRRLLVLMTSLDSKNVQDVCLYGYLI